MERVGMGDSSDEEWDDGKRKKEKDKIVFSGEGGNDRDGESTLQGDVSWEKDVANANGGSNRDRGSTIRRGRNKRLATGRHDLEMGAMGEPPEKEGEKVDEKEVRGRKSFQLPVPSITMVGLEQSMPADAVLAKEGAKEVCRTSYLSFVC